ncbi:MAG: hypothetical protein KA066_02595 [Candidatus Pacebacteria bacterium]|nr:hypothetical protein [Candidatus Paceibacterota bacterium]
MENDMDMQELKELVKRQAQLNADTNKVVHSMRRSQRVHSFFTILWWLLVIGVSVYTYFNYIQPYVEQVVSLYGSAQDVQGQISGFFGQYFGTSTRQ